MKEWLAGLTGRQRVAFGLYGLGLVLMLGSIPAKFTEVNIPGYHKVHTTWGVIGEVGLSWIYGGALVLPTGSWRAFVEGPLLGGSLLLGHLFLVPGGFLLFLASQNRWFCWTARLMWTLLFLGGPMVVLLVDDLENKWGLGCWVWVTWSALVAAAQWGVR